MNFDLEQALDEFDLRYLESYHQVTAKMALLGLRPTPELPLRLLLPLLPSREDHFQVVRESRQRLPVPPAKAPQAPAKPTDNLAHDPDFNLGTEFNLSDYLSHGSNGDEFLDGLENLPQIRPVQATTDHLQFPDRPQLAHRALAPEPQWLTVDGARRLLVLDTGMPRTLQRLFLALSLVHKSQRRPQRRATNVGNPFYKNKPLPRRRRDLFDEAYCKMEC